MSLALAVGVIVVVGVATFAALALAGGGPGVAGRNLRIVAAAVTIVVGVMLAWPAWQDSGSFAAVLVGVPVLCALGVLVLTLAGRPARLATWVAAVAMLLWSLVTALGLGLYFLGPAVVMVAAAAATGRDRRPAAAPRTAPQP